MQIPADDDAPAVTDELILSLLAEREIRNLLTRYCRGVDRCDADLIASCFHDDAVDDHGSWCAQGGKGIAEQIIARVKPGNGRAMHFLGNVAIDVVGTTAFGESYLLAFRTLERDGESFMRTRAVRFIDRFARRSGAWRIVERVVVDDWNRVDPVVEVQEGSHEFRWSRKDREDAVYAIREGRVARTQSDH